MEISELYSYPLKGGRAVSFAASPVLGTGFPNDRRWLLVDAAKGQFISQRSHPALARVALQVDSTLGVRWDQHSLRLPPATPQHGQREVSVWGEKVLAWDLGDEAAEFFSQHLGSPLRFCEAMPSQTRKVDQNYTEGHSINYLFADGFPFLVVSQESLDLLNQKLIAENKPAVTMDRFRPNLVIRGWHPHGEDAIQSLRIGKKIFLRLVKLCSRCNVPQVDQTTGVVGEEPLRTLAGYRKLKGSKIYFGMNAWLLEGEGEIIRVGDAVEVV